MIRTAAAPFVVPTLLSSLAVCVALAACGGGSGAAAPADAAATAGGSTPTTTSTTTATQAAASVTAVAATSSAQDIAAANASAWPFVQPPLATLRGSARKVFAHYFTPFPVSLDNLAAPADYYGSQYLSPQGEGGKFAGSGGFIKQRPLPRTVLADSTWPQVDAAQDVRRAAALGLDGFAVDLLASSGTQWDRARRMLDTAAATDEGFRILLMPDMESEFKSQPGNVLTVVRALARHSAAFRLADGRLVLAPYNAQNQSAAWWKAQLETLRAEGIDVAFWPVFQGWSQYAAEFAPISTGLSDWGDRSPGTNRAWRSAAAQAHARNVKWMATVTPQDSRPKDLLYWEAGNSENYRVMWDNAIAGGADWVQVVTWNDYSEATEVAPSSGTQWSFYDLTAYYTAWFKTGSAPAITKDVLYYFHRRHASSAAPDLTRQTRRYAAGGGSDPAADDIEVLVFAKSAARLRITLGSRVTEQDVPAGLSSVRVPLAEGTPEFDLLRDGAAVLNVKSAFPISNRIVYQDLLYRSGSSSRTLVAPQ